MEYRNTDTLASYKALLSGRKTSPKTLLSANRIATSSVRMGGGLRYNWAAMPVDGRTVSALQALADEAEVVDKYEALLSGERMNTGENRLVLHQLTRGSVLGREVWADGEEKGAFYASVLSSIQSFSRKVRTGEIKGSTGKRFTTVCQIGIGGSDLGPRALYLALRGWAEGKGIRTLRAEFISNVDPDDAAEVISRLDLETTLFILVSKSGTTQETLTNRDMVLDFLRKAPIPGFDASKHMVAVTSKTSPLASDKGMLSSFFIDDYIGGRYSSTSAVGGVVLSLAFGFSTFRALLEGAHEEDVLAKERDIRKNPSLMDALMGFYQRSVLGFPSTAILPYSQALSRFPAHLQQLDMESNGKSVNRFGEPVSYATGPVIFGEPGTNGQHSFYQLLHQGSDIIPLQFIGFRECQRKKDIVTDGSFSQTKLNANLAAQIVAFAKGKEDADLNKNFQGGRPSSLIHGRILSPGALGALLAHYENKVMFQGFLWNLNSFDQEGVQLGKVLAKKVLKGEGDDTVLRAYADILI